MYRKTFNCECGKMFTRKNNLQRHKIQSCKLSSKQNQKIKSKLFSESSPPKQQEESSSIFKKLKTAEFTNNTPLNFHLIGGEKSTPDSSEDESSILTRSDDDDISMVDSDDVSDNSSDNMSPVEDEEDENMNRKVWRVILHWGDNNDCCSDVLDSFKYFCKFTQDLDDYSTIEKIMNSVH